MPGTLLCKSPAKVTFSVLRQFPPRSKLNSNAITVKKTLSKREQSKGFFSPRLSDTHVWSSLSDFPRELEFKKKSSVPECSARRQKGFVSHHRF